jgi:NAD(P)-dependent dehydrogenase (short-subunit alcohol dehydrogenase family)
MADTSPRTVLITGGTSGSAPTVIKRLLDDGYRCVAVYRSAEKWQQIEQTLQHEYLHGVEADLLDEAAMQQAAAQARDLGGGLYAWVNLAGNFQGGSVEETSLDTWNQLVATNMTGAFIAARAVLPHLKEAGMGRIVTMSSAAVPKRQAGAAAYVVAKAGLAVFTEVLANELSKTKITSNVLLLGSLDTEEMRQFMDRDQLVPLDRVAATISFLLSDEGASVTGASIPVTVTG